MRKDARDVLEHRLYQCEWVTVKGAKQALRIKLGQTEVQMAFYAIATPKREVCTSCFGDDEVDRYSEYLQQLMLKVCPTLSQWRIENMILSDDGNVLSVLCYGLMMWGHAVCIKAFPEWVYAATVGRVNGDYLVDLTAEELQAADAILHAILTEDGRWVYMQFDGEYMEMDVLNQLLVLASQAITAIHYPESEAPEMDMKEIVIATNNPKKAKEFKGMFEPKGYMVKTLKDYPDLPDIAETGQTFEENARLKAETISQLLQRPVLGDDSGLCVDALGGQPGIYSARYAGDHDDAANNAKLLSELADVAAKERTAHFHTTLVFAAPGKESLVVEGEVEGLIVGIPQGDNGFGYDPIFYLPELDRTMAQLTPEQKNLLSHRGVAVKRLEKLWESWLEGEA